MPVERLFDKPLRELCRLIAVLDVVQTRQRYQPRGRGVLPVTVQCFLDFDAAEQTLRRDMVTLWRAGLLERIGAESGQATRRGYRIAAA